jgi:cytochrome bd-type quinol oxidase subunit 2
MDYFAVVEPVPETVLFWQEVRMIMDWSWLVVSAAAVILLGVLLGLALRNRKRAKTAKTRLRKPVTALIITVILSVALLTGSIIIALSGADQPPKSKSPWSDCGDKAICMVPMAPATD